MQTLTSHSGLKKIECESVYRRMARAFFVIPSYDGLHLLRILLSLCGLDVQSVDFYDSWSESVQ